MASNKRPPPAYQEYAASMLAQITFREASLAARGLLWTLRLECWVNGKVPADPKRLGRLLGSSDDLSPLLGEIRPFFEVSGEFMACPELEGYREELSQRRAKQSAGGKSGAEMTNASKAKQRAGNSTATPAGSGRVLSTVQNSQDQKSQNQSLGRDFVPDDFVTAYEAHEQR